MKKVLALSFGLYLWIGLPSRLMAQTSLNNVILGHSGGVQPYFDALHRVSNHPDLKARNLVLEKA